MNPSIFYLPSKVSMVLKRETSISPPPLKRLKQDPLSPLLESSQGKDAPSLVPSPIHLTNVPDLPESSNIDTVSLGDVLGDPLIKEAWLFNYLIDVDFVM